MRRGSPGHSTWLGTDGPFVLDHARRRIVHVNVTDQPSARWTAQQLNEAFPYDTAPRYLHRDRDSIYGSYFTARVRGMGIEQVVSAPRAPWQNPYPYVERVSGRAARSVRAVALSFSVADRVVAPIVMRMGLASGLSAGSVSSPPFADGGRDCASASALLAGRLDAVGASPSERDWLAQPTMKQVKAAIVLGAARQ